jgi:hypothetical protein
MKFTDGFMENLKNDPLSLHNTPEPRRRFCEELRGNDGEIRGVAGTET